MFSISTATRRWDTMPGPSSSTGRLRETAWNQGKPTLAEEKTGMRCFDYLADGDDVSYQQWETVGANVDRLPLLASIWSVDPVVFEDPAMRMKPGWIGRLPMRRSKMN